MISIKEIDAKNVLDVCELTKYYPEMCLKAIYWKETLI